MADNVNITSTKKDIPMNVLVCGSKIEKLFIKSLFNDKIKKSYKNKDDYEEYNYSYGWKFQFFKEGLNKENLDLIFKKIEEDFKSNTFNDTIVCFIGDSLENAKNVIKYFSEKAAIFQTFIIFITTNKDITKKVLHEFTQSEELEDEFDSRNLEVLQYSSNDIISLFNILFLKACYFNEMGNEMVMPEINGETLEKKGKGKHCFNILIIGKPGTGKSTFINIMNGNKLAKEGTGGGKVTYNICQYHVKNTNFVLYDTPGFGTGNEFEKVNKYITSEIEEMAKRKEHFHCVIYMLNHYDKRNFDKPEEKLINDLLKFDMPFYFLLNYSQKPKEIGKKKKKQKDEKKQILEEEIKIKFQNKYIKVISVNLKTNDNDSCFGLDILFNDLYEFYKDKNIDLYQLRLYKSDKNKIEELIKNSPFFRGLTNEKEILENLIFKCKMEIYAFSALSAAVGFIPIPFSDWPILIGIQATMVISIAAQFGITLEKEEAGNIVKNLSKSSLVGGFIAGAGKLIGSLSKSIPGIGTAVGGTISGSTAGIGTLSLGQATISFFKPKFEIFNFCMDRANSFNETIDLLKKYTEEFKKDDYIYLLSS